MSDTDNPQYEPSKRFDNVATLFGNHYRLVLDALPDLTFFVQSFTMPTVSAAVVQRPNPFTTIPEVADHLTFDTFKVSYLVDNNFKTYFSLFYWLKGYGFPTSYQDILDFETARKTHIPNPRPRPREIQKTNATLTILQPDNDTPVADVFFYDVFPTAIGEMQFESVDSEPTLLKTNATFYYTDFNIRLTNT